MTEPCRNLGPSAARTSLATIDRLLGHVPLPRTDAGNGATPGGPDDLHTPRQPPPPRPRAATAPGLDAPPLPVRQFRRLRPSTGEGSDPPLTPPLPKPSDARASDPKEPTSSNTNRVASLLPPGFAHRLGSPSTRPTMAIIREMKAYALSPSRSAPSDPPAPGAPTAESRGTARQGSVPAAEGPDRMAGPPVAEACRRAVCGEAAPPEAPSHSPCAIQLPTTFGLRDHDHPLASDTEVLLEAQLGTFTRLIGPGRNDLRRMSFAHYLTLTQAAVRDEHFFIGPAGMDATWDHFKQARRLLHPAYTTSVTIVAQIGRAHV